MAELIIDAGKLETPERRGFARAAFAAAVSSWNTARKARIALTRETYTKARPLYDQIAAAKLAKNMVEARNRVDAGLSALNSHLASI